MNYTYDPNHPHAVASLSNGRTYQYDANGNQTTRVIGSDSYSLIYDAENRLVEVKKNGLTIATFTYDGDGKRVKSVIGGETILFVGKYYEVVNGSATKYYFAGDQRIAMRKNGTLSYLLGDHLGSLSFTTDANGNKISELKYKAWGEVRYSSGAAVTDYTFTGQYSNVDDFGLMYYGARWYDPGLSRCTQPDSVIPDYSNPLDWDRYNYTRNNPARYTDSSGHCIDGLTTIPCLLALIALAGGAGGAAYYEWNVTGHSWWESPEYASGTAQAAVEGALLAEGVGLAVGSAAAVAAPTLASGLCADGDCTNEVTAVAETSNNATSNTTSALVEYYPPNNGFQGAPNLQTLPPGSLMSRYGSTYGKFLSPAGTPAWARALPPGAENLPLNTYEVLKPLTVWAGPVASWFGEIGGGMQYYTGDTGPTIQTLIDLGYLIPR